VRPQPVLLELAVQKIRSSNIMKGMGWICAQ
jgi:hypothetical protein